MTLEELAGMLEKTGFPFAYDHFAEGESPDPPFICFLLPRLKIKVQCHRGRSVSLQMS